ncbi:MAG: choice-of-anchor Q domain-containing protein [Kiritimatiellia bacterium]
MFKHDDLYPNFYGNESVEIYIKPDAQQDRYYWFVLSADNVTFEQSITLRPASQNISWEAPWRSFTKILPNGWTAEVAIPLYVFNCDDLAGMQLNIVRNLRNIALDQYGAKQSEQTVLSTLLPETMGRPKTHDFKQFAAVDGLGGFKPVIPFAPKIAAAEVTSYYAHDDKYFYDVKVTLMRYTEVAGRAEVRVMEDIGQGHCVKQTELVDLDGKPEPGQVGPYQRNLVLRVPAGDLRERKVQITLIDAVTGNCLAGKTIEELSALQVVKEIFVGRSYYTSEAQVDIHLELGLPDALLSSAALALNINGAKLHIVKGLQPEATLAIPLSEFDFGENALDLQLVSGADILAEKRLTVRRHQPRPGYEVKADFSKGILLKNDKPVFPVGMSVAHWDSNYAFKVEASGNDQEEAIKYLGEAGFTTLILENFCKQPDTYQARAADSALFASLADKYGMDVLDWSSPIPPPSDNAPGTPLADRLDFQRKRYATMEPVLAANIKTMREQPNLLIYYNVDEPNLVNPDERIAVAEWYWETVRKIDPYRPLCMVYSMNIPHGDTWTAWSEAIGFDIYPRPFTGGIYSEPGLYTAFYAHILRERCRHDHKVMLFVPLSNYLELGRTPISMSKAHMLCQAYTAIIYGARGLVYFVLHVVAGGDAWDALRMINAQIREMSPALLNGDIPQQISYIPDDFNPAAQKFPMVNAAVFQYPDGDYLLLAANIVAHAVETKFKIDGLQAATRLFTAEGQSEMDLDGESFSDKLEAYGVRAYRLRLMKPAMNPVVAQTPAPAGPVIIVKPQQIPVQATLEMQALVAEPAPIVKVDEIRRQVMAGKNHIPNPCFQKQFNPGVPDFFLPAWGPGHDPYRGQPGSSWFLDQETLWHGIPAMCMVYSKPPLSQGLDGMCYIPDAVDGQPPKMVFSCYAKGARDGDKLKVYLPFATPQIKIFTLSTEWERFQVAGEIVSRPYKGFKGGHLLRLSPEPPAGSRIWVTGLQMERGDTATEFQDDSVVESHTPKARGPATLHVAPDGDDARSGIGDWSNAVATISNALSKAGAGDTVLISNGLYVVTAPINLDFSVRVQGWPPATAPTGVVITTLYPDPAHSTRCASITSPGAVLSGVTIERGYPNDRHGAAGGIWLAAGIVSNCIIRRCRANYGGGGIRADAGAVITDCTIISNRNSGGDYACAGGGVFLGQGAELRRSLIAANYDEASSSYNAGGVYVYGANCRIVDCCIVDNENAGSAGSGGGMHLAGTGGHIVENCIISNNHAKTHAGGIAVAAGINTISGAAITHNRTANAGGGILAVGNSLVQMSNCTVAGNAAAYGAGLANNANTASRGNLNVTHSCIAANTSVWHAAGAFLIDNTGCLAHSVIVSNVACGGNGAGLYVGSRGDWQTSMSITNCLIADNKLYGSQAHGGGIYIDQAGLTLASCTIAGNSARHGGGISLSPEGSAGNLMVCNTIIASNTADGTNTAELELPPAAPDGVFRYSCSPALSGSQYGNISDGPVFAGTDAGNYRLAAGSPGIDAGTNQAWMVEAVDLDGRPRIDSQRSRVDMGAYEY